MVYGLGGPHCLFRELCFFADRFFFDFCAPLFLDEVLTLEAPTSLGRGCDFGGKIGTDGRRWGTGISEVERSRVG